MYVERRVVLAFGIDPFERLREEHIGAIAFGFDERAVVQNDGIEILVVRRVAAAARIGLADAAGAVNEDFVEAALVRLIGGFVAEVPFAEDAGGVSREA